MIKMAQIKELKTGKILSEDDLALKLYKEGHHIVYCDLEGTAKLENGDFFLIDECGNSVWIDPEKFEVIGFIEPIEKLAELEHEQWVNWSKNIAQKEKLSSERIDRWKKLWVPYSELSEEMKEEDRIWARKVLEIMRTIPG